MCFGLGCPYERNFGECRGQRDWSQPDAACNGQETQPREPLADYERRRWASGVQASPEVLTCYGR